MTKEELKDRIEVVRSALSDIVCQVEEYTDTFSVEDWERVSQAADDMEDQICLIEDRIADSD